MKIQEREREGFVLSHQLDEAVLHLGELVLELSVLGEGAADGGLVTLGVLQDLAPVLHLLGRLLRLPLQLLQASLLLLAQPGQLPVVSHLHTHTHTHTHTRKKQNKTDI